MNERAANPKPWLPDEEFAAWEKQRAAEKAWFRIQWAGGSDERRLVDEWERAFKLGSAVG